MSDRLTRWLASAGGLGRFPVAPGTFGSLVGIPYALALCALPALWARCVVIAAVSLLAVPVCTRAERIIGATDPHEIVLDEIVAFPLAVVLTPPHPVAWGIAFVVFRAMDVVKPFPAGRSQRLPGGWGVVVDDLWAGFYTAAVLQLGRLIVKFPG